jgi:hypothetical protein
LLQINLSVEEERLAEMQDKSASIQQVLEGLEHRRNDLIREQAWRQNALISLSC